MSRCDARVSSIEEYSPVVNPVVPNHLPTSTDELSSFFFVFEIHMHVSSAVFNFFRTGKRKTQPQRRIEKEQTLT